MSHSLNFVTGRFFNTVGPRQLGAYGMVVPRFVKSAIADAPLTIYGDGKQTRSFCYVDDNIDGMYKLMNSRDGFTGPVNIGNPGEFTMLELAQLVIELTNSKSTVNKANKNILRLI